MSRRANEARSSTDSCKRAAISYASLAGRLSGRARAPSWPRQVNWFALMGDKSRASKPQCGRKCLFKLVFSSKLNGLFMVARTC